MLVWYCISSIFIAFYASTQDDISSRLVAIQCTVSIKTPPAKKKSFCHLLFFPFAFTNSSLCKKVNQLCEVTISQLASPGEATNMAWPYLYIPCPGSTTHLLLRTHGCVGGWQSPVLQFPAWPEPSAYYGFPFSSLSILSMGSRRERDTTTNYTGPGRCVTICSSSHGQWW